MLPRDVVVLPERDGRWVVMNVFARTSLATESSALRLLATGGDATRFDGETFRVWEVEWFSNSEGLLADPTRYRRDVASWPAPEQLDATALVARLRKHLLLVDDDETYASRFAAKRTLIDGERLGNFHQQLGQHLLLERRENPETWWVRQKFRDDLRGVRNNLYGAVQEYALRQYFARRFQPGDEVVDLGCGTGFYSSLMAEAGATVLGVDPNEKYIAIAREHAAPRARFETVSVGSAGALDQIPTGSADYVFMSDALLFYFVPASPKQVADIQVLFRDIARILKPGGTFISVEPHGIFWLMPWLGDERRPFTVLTEYAQRTFAVTPNVSTFIQACARGGFAVTWMEELLPDPQYEQVDRRGYHFARQFPLWQLYECRRLA
jgi:SAM-dependent methyltransferase